MINLLLLMFSVTKTFTVRVFSAERPTQVTLSSADGTYNIQAAGDGLIVNGNSESYFQQMGHPPYSISGAGITRIYDGGFTIFSAGAELFILNYIPEESYLASVVTSELPLGNIEARKAQAVAARTYAYNNMGDHDRGYDLVDSELSQVYKGFPVNSLALRAVRETEGLILGYQGQIADVYYHSTCGGMTLLPSDIWRGAKDQPYHQRVVDTLCKNSPYFTWTDSFHLDTLARGMGFFRIDSINPVRKDREAVLTPVVGFIVYAPDSTAINYRDFFAGADHYPKTRRFDAEMSGDHLLIHGHGYGHGVGMCQFGAVGLADAGYNYIQILQYYFPGTQIMSVSSIR